MQKRRNLVEKGYSSIYLDVYYSTMEELELNTRLTIYPNLQNSECPGAYLARKYAVKDAVDDFHSEISSKDNVLKKEWGKNYDHNLALANRAIQRFCPSDIKRRIEEFGLIHDPAIAKLFLSISQTLSGEG